MKTPFLLLHLMVACGQPYADDRPLPPSDEPRFAAESGMGPSLRLDGGFETDGLRVTVLADDLGPIFGLAGSLVFDPEHLTVARAELAPDLLPDAAELLRVEEDRIVFGIAREGPERGDWLLDGTGLVTVSFVPKRSGHSKLVLSRAMVRRSDGAFVRAAFLGAAVDTVEVGP